MEHFASEVLPGLLVAAALLNRAIQAVDAAAGDSFWPTSLRDILAILVIVAGAVGAGWKWLVRPLRKADRAQREEMARVSTFAHTLGGRVELLAESVREVEHSRNTIQRDMGRLEKQVEGLANQHRRENELRNRQHSDAMNALGEIKGQLKAMHRRT